jgi:hypothetical protein
MGVLHKNERMAVEIGIAPETAIRVVRYIVERVNLKLL